MASWDVPSHSQMHALGYTREDCDCDDDLQGPEIDKGALVGVDGLGLRVAEYSLPR